MSGGRSITSSPSRTQRWLDLLTVLVGHRYPVPIDRVMEQVPAYRSRWTEGDETDRQSVRRLFERDKAGLRALGIQIEAERLYPGAPGAGGMMSAGEVEGYRVRPHDFYLPYLKLIPGAREGASGRASEGGGVVGARVPGSSPHATGTVTLPEGDVAAGVAALRAVLTLPSFPFMREARSALGKLTFDLDPDLTAPGGGPDSRILLLDRPGGADPAGVLGVLMGALHDRMVVAVEYRSISGNEVRERILEPWGLLFQWGSWYLVARLSISEPPPDPDHAGLRVFRVDRMSGARVLHPGARTPQFEIPDDFELRQWAGRKAWDLGADEGMVEILVHFLPPASLHAERNGWGEPADVHSGEGSPPVPGALRRFQVTRQDPFLRWILSFGGEARVVGPDEAAGTLRELALRVAAVHREAGARAPAEGPP